MRARSRCCRSRHALRASCPWRRPSPVNIEQARQRAAAAGLQDHAELQVGRAEEIPLPDASIDVLWCKESITFTELDQAMREFRRVMRAGAIGVIYQVLTGPAMSASEEEWLTAQEMGFGPGRSLRPDAVEQAIRTSGLQVRERVDYASEWGEAGEETDGGAGRRLLHTARLIHSPQLYIDRYGVSNYRIMLADCLWHVYRMTGKLWESRFSSSADRDHQTLGSVDPTKRTTAMTHPWSSHTIYSDPGRHAGLIRAIPEGAASACTTARNVIGHFGTGFAELRGPQRDEVNLRSVARILEVDQARHPYALDRPRDPQTRVAGCCRDHSVLVVGILREQGIPARTRVGFADYLVNGRRVDHVVVDYQSEGRWIRTDPEMTPGTVPFDPTDMEITPDGRFQTAAEAWQSCRQGRDDFAHFQVPPGSGFSDAAHVIRAYVALELAHRAGEELLLWDTWPGLDAFDADLVDRVASLLLAADAGEVGSAADLAAIYSRFGPRGTVTQLSPFGAPPQQVKIGSRYDL